MTDGLKFPRRRFIAGMGVASVSGLRASADANAPDGSGALPEYLLAPGLIHLNTASLGATPRVVLESTLQAWAELESSPVFMAYGGGPVVTAADKVRERAASLLGCAADEMLITRGTTDAMNTIAQAVRLSRGDRVLTTDQEHDGGSMCWRYRERRDGVAVDRVSIELTQYDSGEIVRRFAAAITPATRVISVSHIITTTGLRMPIAEISKLARERDVLCVVDGAQAVGHISVDVKELGCHAYASSGHKWLMGPKGTGLLYLANGAGFEPIQWEDGRRYSAESAGLGTQPLTIGLGAAIELLQSRGMGNVQRHAIALRTRAYDGLKRIPGLKVVGPPPGGQATAMVAFALPDEIDSRAFRDALRVKHKVIVKMCEKRWLNGIRLSPHLLNSEADIDRALQAIHSELG